MAISDFGAMSSVRSTANKLLSDEFQREKRQALFLSDPEKADTQVAHILANISPAVKKPQLGKFASKTDAYESMIPEDHPFKGFGEELKSRLNAVVSDPRNRGVDPLAVSAALADKMLNEPDRTGGTTRLEAAMEYKRRKDAEFFNWGEDIKTRKPFGPLYDKWLEMRRTEETPEAIADRLREAGKFKEAQSVLDEASPIATPGGVLLNAGVNAAVGMVAGGPPLALLGALGGVGQELFGRPLSKKVLESEWYKANYGPLTATGKEFSFQNLAVRTGIGALVGGLKYKLPGAVIGGAAGAFSSTNIGEKLLAEMAPYIVAGGVFDAASAFTLLVPKAAAKAIFTNPTAGTVVEAGKALATGRKMMSDENVVGRLVNKLFDPRGKELGVNRDAINGIKTVFRSLTPEGRRSNTVLRGLSKGIEEHLKNTQSIWENLAFGQQLKRTAEDLAITPEEYTVWASRAIKQFDDIAIEDFLTHPNLHSNMPEAIDDAVARQVARKLATDADGKVANKIEDEIWTTTASFRRAQADATKKVGKAISLSRGTKTAKEVYTPEVLAEAFAGVTKLRKAATADVAKAVDAVAETVGVKPTQAFDSVAAKVETFEAPAVKPAVDVTSAPTELGAVATGAENNVASPMYTVRRLSERAQRSKIMILQKRADAGDEAAAEELKFLQAKTQFAERETAKAKQGIPTLEEVKKQTAAENAEVDSITKSLLQERERSAQAPKFKEGVATEAEASEKPVDVIRGEGKEAAKIQETKLTEAKAAETEHFEKLKRYQKLSPDANLNLINSIQRSFANGQMTAEQALKEVENITDVVSHPQYTEKHFASGYTGSHVGTDMETVANEGLNNWLDQSQGFVDHLRTIVGNKTFMALFGVTAGTLAYFIDPKTAEMGPQAEAGLASKVISGIEAVKDVGKATAAFNKSMREAGYVVDTAVPKNKFLLAYSEYQRGLRGTAEGGPQTIIGKINEWAAKAPKESLRHRLMSPGMIFDEVLGIGKQLMNNPAVFRASYQAAEYNNILRSSQVVKNILDDAGIKGATQEVRELFKPLTQDMKKQVEFEWRKENIKNLKTEIERLESGKGKAKQAMVEAQLEGARDALKEHEASIELLKDAIPEFHKKWAPIAEQAAKDYSSVRVFLALGDDANFTKYPFMKNIPLSSDEQVAVGRLREHLLQYKQRIKDIKEETISGPYAPHIFHPDFKPRDFAGMMGGEKKVAAYMKMFRRSFDSRPLMPDIEASMMRYIGDTERRIQNITFWKREGWKNVMEASQHIPVVYRAFKMIEDGMKPIDMSFSNQLAQRYIEFESIKRLFLSPSATLKHIIKQTGDIAQRRIKETAGAYPETIKMTGIRMAEANPSVAPALSKLGITAKSEQDRFMQDYFKCIVPAQGTRRMLLDLGLTGNEEVFARAKSIWGKLQDVGGAGINFAELWDRGLSVTLGYQLANAKAGTTIEQALYGTYDMILRNNFLSRELNPAWLNNPKVKAMLMFQGTPFKIFERRMVNFLRSGRVIKDMGKEIFEATKADYKNNNFDETRKILGQIRNIRDYIKGGEHALKANIFVDALMKERDFFGSSVVSTFAKDVAIVAAATYGGANAGMNLYHHFFHLPFLQTTTDEPTLNLNPGVSAIIRGLNSWKQREEGDDEFLVSKIMQHWLGKGWYSTLPDTATKLYRMSQNDIPKIYQESPYRYLFAVPGLPSK